MCLARIANKIEEHTVLMIKPPEGSGLIPDCLHHKRKWVQRWFYVEQKKTLVLFSFLGQHRNIPLFDLQKKLVLMLCFLYNQRKGLLDGSVLSVSVTCPISNRLCVLRGVVNTCSVYLA